MVYVVHDLIFNKGFGVYSKFYSYLCNRNCKGHENHPCHREQGFVEAGEDSVSHFQAGAHHDVGQGVRVGG